MSQEAVMIAVDNSDYMRNGDFNPTRLQAQSDAVNLLCQVKRQANPENTVGLLTLANTTLLCTLTSDMSKIANRLHAVQPKGGISFCDSIRIAQLALRHRSGRHQKMRIVCFIGSPITDDLSDMKTLAKKLKKEKVNVDVVNFGEDEVNQQSLVEFVDIVNGKDGTGSHLVTVPPGTVLHESLATSPIIAGEDGAGALVGSGLGLEFSLDAAEDPDLMYALRISMEEQRRQQEGEANAGGAAIPGAAALPGGTGTSDDDLLRQALAMSMQVDQPSGGNAGAGSMDIAAMTEEEQIAYAIQMSMQAQEEEATKEAEGSSNNNRMDVDDIPATPISRAEGPVGGGTLSTAADAVLGGSESKPDTEGGSADYDPAFLQNVLQNLPGVDTQNPEVRQAIESISAGKKGDDSKKKKEESEKKE